MISAIVPTYRGQSRLEANLDSVAAALRGSGETWEILVLDDGGGGIGISRERGTRVIALPENRGYGPAVNAGVKEAKGDYLLILNDDVRLEEGAVRILRSYFPDPGLFAVVPAIRSPLAECGDEGGKAGSWNAGLLEIEEVDRDRPHPTLYPVGCCFLCPRQLFLDIGGYDDVLAPFFWEDVDLGYRAWRHGLTILHAPAAVCHHQGSATLAEHRSLAERERTYLRNRVLFHLRNLQDPGARAENFGAWAAFALFEARPERQEGLAEALAAYRRVGRRFLAGLSDAAILEKVRSR